MGGISPVLLLDARTPEIDLNGTAKRNSLGSNTKISDQLSLFTWQNRNSNHETFIIYSRWWNSSGIHFYLPEWQPFPLWLQNVLDQRRSPGWLVEHAIPEQHCGARPLVSRMYELSRWILGCHQSWMWCWIISDHNPGFLCRLNLNIELDTAKSLNKFKIAERSIVILFVHQRQVWMIEINVTHIRFSMETA